MTHKGIAAMARAPYRLQACAAPPAPTNSFLACTVVGPCEFNLLAVWAHPKPSYVSDIWTALDAHRDWFAERPTVIAGDFNSHPRWDRQGIELTHKALEHKLSDEFGLVSAWHAAHPQEPEPGTYYQWQNGVQQPFHIDYCFIPQAWTNSLQRVTIGSLADYEGQSDHRPLMIEVLGMPKKLSKPTGGRKPSTRRASTARTSRASRRRRISHAVDDGLYERILDDGEEVAYQEWDSGGPGAGAGRDAVYRYGRKFYVLGDADVSGPYATMATAIAEQAIDQINDATVCIWRTDKGFTFER